MATYDNNRRYDKSYRNDAPKRPKPVRMTLPLLVTAKAGSGLKVDSAYDLMAKLAEAGTFDILSVTAALPRKYIAPENKGTVQAARVVGFDAEKRTVDLLFFGRNIEYAKVVGENEWVVLTNVLVNRNDETASTILGFNIVNELDVEAEG